MISHSWDSTVNFAKQQPANLIQSKSPELTPSKKFWALVACEVVVSQASPYKKVRSSRFLTGLIITDQEQPTLEYGSFSLSEKTSKLLFSLHRHFCFFGQDRIGEQLLSPLPKPFEELSLSYGWHQAPVTNQFLPEMDL